VTTREPDFAKLQNPRYLQRHSLWTLKGCNSKRVSVSSKRVMFELLRLYSNRQKLPKA